jgi:hypothetical protein
LRDYEKASVTVRVVWHTCPGRLWQPVPGVRSCCPGWYETQFSSEPWAPMVDDVWGYLPPLQWPMSPMIVDGPLVPGTLSGTVSTESSFLFTVQATNAYGSDTQQFAETVTAVGLEVTVEEETVEQGRDITGELGAPEPIRRTSTTPTREYDL